MMEGKIWQKTEASGICTVTIDNPEKSNAINSEMWEDLRRLASEINSDNSVRVVVLTGQGGTFAAGADISEFSAMRTGDNAPAYDRLTETAIDAFASISKPTISAIRGFCIGGGVNLMLATDIRICALSSIFAVPPARLGIAYPKRSLERLVEAVGEQQAKYLLFSARRIDAPRAQSIGLISETVEADLLDEVVSSLATQITKNAPLSIRAAKLGIRAMRSGSEQTWLSQAEESSEKCYLSEDYREGVDAFLNHRSPHFHGR